MPFSYVRRAEEQALDNILLAHPVTNCRKTSCCKPNPKGICGATPLRNAPSSTNAREPDFLRLALPSPRLGSL
jgi:hypothetical protein